MRVAAFIDLFFAKRKATHSKQTSNYKPQNCNGKPQNANRKPQTSSKQHQQTNNQEQQPVSHRQTGSRKPQTANRKQKTMQTVPSASQSEFLGRGTGAPRLRTALALGQWVWLSGSDARCAQQALWYTRAHAGARVACEKDHFQGTCTA